MVIQSVVHTHWLTVHSVHWAESWTVCGQFVVVPLSKNIKCSSPPNHACSNECFFSITKPQTLKKKIRVCARFQEVIFLRRMWFGFGKHSIEQAWFGGGEHFIFLDLGTTTNWPALSSVDTVDSKSVCVHHTLDDDSIQLHVKNPELFL